MPSASTGLLEPHLSDRVLQRGWRL